MKEIMDSDSKQNLHVGKITGTIGLRGEIKIFHLADEPAVLKACSFLIIDGQKYNIKNIRYKKKIPIIRLEGIDNIDMAEAMKGKEIYMDPNQLPELPDDSYYIKDLVGLNVVSVEDGRHIGVIIDVILGAAQDVYEIEDENGKKILIPAVSDFIIDVDTAANRIQVKLPEGIEEIKY